MPRVLNHFLFFITLTAHPSISSRVDQSFAETELFFSAHLYTPFIH